VTLYSMQKRNRKRRGIRRAGLRCLVRESLQNSRYVKAKTKSNCARYGCTGLLDVQMK
jgi:hypothetical protein